MAASSSDGREAKSKSIREISLLGASSYDVCKVFGIWGSFPYSPLPPNQKSSADIVFQSVSFTPHLGGYPSLCKSRRDMKRLLSFPLSFRSNVCNAANVVVRRVSPPFERKKEREREAEMGPASAEAEADFSQVSFVEAAETKNAKANRRRVSFARLRVWSKRYLAQW